MLHMTAHVTPSILECCQVGIKNQMTPGL